MELTVDPGVLVGLLLLHQPQELVLWDKGIMGEQTIYLSHIPPAAAVAPAQQGTRHPALSLVTAGLDYNHQYQVLQHITPGAEVAVHPIILSAIYRAPAVLAEVVQGEFTAARRLWQVL
jgi:hypothetical protein